MAIQGLKAYFSMSKTYNAEKKLILQKNKAYYNARVAHYERMPFAEILPPLIEKYKPQMPGFHALDIGSGPGALAQWLSQKGFSVLCLDPSEEMIKRCQEKGLRTFLGTIQEFTTNEKFDCICAISSLIHIKKDEIKEQLRKIAFLLNPQGLVFLSVLKGEGDSWADPEQVGIERFFSIFSPEEIAALFEPEFEIVEVHERETRSTTMVFLIYVLRKR